ncbi:CDF family Co(II)/Ni(II) efflux transporter DmeF [Hydrocarboniphaga effusa]|uniref:CDF family Co(II)/Ni(II) efflux transporter DmeF n=1 Tax=Hydrocarboniphaga effusa TaxID=243629 RepID=UPI003138457A
MPACPAAREADGGHAFLGDDHHDNSRRMIAVVALTLVTMVVEIAVGYWSGSMALLADGWHMASHAVALGISAFAYGFARRHANNPRYSFGTGKIGDLSAFTSSLMLGAIGALMIVESVQRLRSPVTVAYGEALLVAVLGLLVNLASAALLHGGAGHSHGPDHDHHDHDHDHDHATGQHESHADHNLRSAYLHVLADALTSILAIAALLAGLYLGWQWTDPLIGIVGGIVILQWAWSLARRTAMILLDASVDPALARRVQQRLEAAQAQVSDLHLWRLAPGKFAVIASVQSAAPLTPAEYKQRLADLPGLAHVTIEVEPAQAP